MKQNKTKHNKKTQDMTANRDAAENYKKKSLIRRILMLLGKLGGENQKVLTESPLEEIVMKTDKAKNGHQMTAAEAAGRGLAINPDIVAWDTENKVRYVWAFVDTKVTVYLDSVLPRLAELALNVMCCFCDCAFLCLCFV